MGLERGVILECPGISRDGLGHIGLGTGTWCHLGMSWDIPGRVRTYRTWDLNVVLSLDVLGYPGIGYIGHVGLYCGIYLGMSPGCV